MLNRGNHRQMLFRHEEEFASFLEILSASVAKFEVTLWGYCLMGNHWHLVAEVRDIKELGRWMHWLCNRHVRRFHPANVSLGGGHLYQGRYKSFPIQDAGYLFNVLHYVEADPLRAKLVWRAQDWPWSSTSVVPVRHGMMEVERPSLALWTRDDRWHEAVNQPLTLDQLDGLRQSVIRGTPQGDPVWIKTLVTKANMESTVRPRGRPLMAARGTQTG